MAENFHASQAAKLYSPDNAPHISAHNAVKTQILSTTDGRKEVHDRMVAMYQARLDENYAKARRRAQKKGRELPSRDEYYNHWGYSYYSKR